ncbi:hypothetical protein BDV96DRAFT_568729 [Lophiotrema nucula]|uniref:Uncharacterized protein n=1 Tax=Lophiotrema nucula TaxID=690887 RepID=A0A6A5ZIE4_9PLEO|nr:hypothetical protein BDV96DRAFT_568729 [Lophiotrema nucula]
MAINLKRKRVTVSYREPSTDEDLSEDSDSAHIRERIPATPGRRSARHQVQVVVPSSSKSSQRPTSRAEAPSTRRNTVARLRKKPVVTYRESSSDDEVDDDYAEEKEEATAPPQRRPRGATAAPSPRAQLARRPRGRPKSALGAPIKRRKTLQQTAKIPEPIISDGRIPAWASLPYHVLLQVFVYASHPLHDENMVPTPSISWLARTARMCTAFTKPALTALYRNPPIFAVRHKRADLVRHLISPPSGAEDHASMPKRLELDATRMTKLTDATNSAADLVALVTALKTLRDIDIFDPIDKPPYRERTKQSRRWQYPDSLFDALRQSDLRLRTWRWNKTFFAHDLLWMKNVHADLPFQGLRELALNKFHSNNTWDATEIDTTAEEQLASALAALPTLSSVTFESCTVVNKHLLPLLPTHLLSLNLTNCAELNSEALSAFLTTHGSRLDVLVLNHNQALDISFLIDMKLTCPRLEVLRMDLNYFSSFSTSHDNEPLYDDLLREGDVPSWPSTLQVIDMQYLRHWSPNAATGFFSSLIGSAPELPQLREVTIVASVDIEWRKRAEFREKWTARFQQVFAQRASPPDPHLVSLRAFRESKASQGDATEGKNDSLIDSATRSDQQGQVKVPAIHDDSDSDAPLVPRRTMGENWTSTRLRTRGKASRKYDESSDSESDDYKASASGEEEQELFIQGRCHTVLFRIDNLRPREEIYGEGDFLDSEASGDEDWDGNDYAEETTLYAW